MESLIIGIGGYILYTLPVYVIASKSGHDLAWLAFVPFANLWLMCDMADVPILCLILMLIPYVNVVVYAVLWYRISENTNKPGWIGLLMVVPLLNLLVMYFLAFVDTGRFVA